MDVLIVAGQMPHEPSAGHVAPCVVPCLCSNHPISSRLTPFFLLAQPTGSATCKRGFCQFIYEPIKTVIEAAMNDNKDKLFALLDKLEVRPGYRGSFGWGGLGWAV